MLPDGAMHGIYLLAWFIAIVAVLFWIGFLLLLIPSVKSWAERKLFRKKVEVEEVTDSRFLD